MQLLYQSHICISNITFVTTTINEISQRTACLILNPESNPDTNHHTPELTTAGRDKVTGERELFGCEYFRAEKRGCQHSNLLGRCTVPTGSYRRFGESYILHPQHEEEQLCVTSCASPTSEGQAVFTPVGFVGSLL
jgi:hypothetical protein